MEYTTKKCDADETAAGEKKERRKVLFASKDLNMGGMEKALVALLSAIDKDLYDVTLVLEKAEGALFSQLDSRVKVVEYKVSAFPIVPVRKALNLFRRTLFVAKYGKKYDFSCCYATYSTPCEKIAKLASGNCSLYVHSDYVGMYGGDLEKAKSFYDSIGIEGYKKVFFVSDGGRKGALEIYPGLENKFETVGNLVNSQEILEAAEEDLGVPTADGKKRFLFVGRLDDTSKKLKRLLKAVSLVSEKRDDFELWIIGSGPDERMYLEFAEELKITDLVRFLGQKTNPYPFIKSADCLVLTSDYEGFPVVYTEAAVLGTPIITTVPASDGFFAVDNANAWVSEKTPEAVAKSMVNFMEDGTFKVPTADFDCINSEKIKILYRNMDK